MACREKIIDDMGTWDRDSALEKGEREGLAVGGTGGGAVIGLIVSSRRD